MFYFSIPMGSMYGIYANIGDILMVNVTTYIGYMDPMGYIGNVIIPIFEVHHFSEG